MTDPVGWMSDWMLDAARIALLAALFVGAVWVLIWLVDRSDRRNR